MKPVESAETSTEHLSDGRGRWSIVHDILHDVTPQMLVWWFNHMDGEVEIGSTSINRYRARHPRDHVAITYVRKAASSTSITLLSDQMGHAWLTHNVEEVGNLEHFLPTLFDQHT